jgi:RNase H-fold protein (predicted Holliday junction resolvase)
LIQQLIEQAVEANINKLVDQLCADSEWTHRVERLINQAVVQETLKRLGSVDLGPTIKDYVDENMKHFTSTLVENFHSTGISDQATQCELTVMDEAVVVENCLTAKHIEVVDSARIQHLVVTGSINTDNQSWSALASAISQRTLDQLTVEWSESLTQQVITQIQQQGIGFEDIKVGDEKLVNAGKLSSAITESNLQSVGVLKTLQVRGEAHINNNTANVLNKRLGVNTDAPEMALSVWDEEVSVVVGKNKANEAYIGTNRDQSIVIGVNRKPQIELNTTGLTTVKKLQVGLHKISHDVQVPGWSGTRGDLVFNSNPGPDRVFAWVCLGAHRWQVLKSAE